MTSFIDNSKEIFFSCWPFAKSFPSEKKKRWWAERNETTLFYVHFQTKLQPEKRLFGLLFDLKKNVDIPLPDDERKTSFKWLNASAFKAFFFQLPFIHVLEAARKVRDRRNKTETTSFSEEAVGNRRLQRRQN